MKKIAITQRLIENNTYFEIRDSLDINWGNFFSELNYLPIILPTNYNFNSYFENIDISGILLSGGNSLSQFENNNLSEKRDKFEKDLISFAIKKNIPILGICRGMQIIANYFDCEFEKIDNHAGTRHKIIVENTNSQYFNYLKEIKEVNSFHNYGITKISDDLIISAKSYDGYIEAFEHKKYKIFCQMWHPEREDKLNIHQINIIKYLYG